MADKKGLIALALIGLVTAVALASKAKAAPPEKGTLNVNSEPQGATIIINGSSEGITPTTFEMNPATYTVQLDLSGYQLYSQNITIVGGQTSVIDAVLTLILGGEYCCAYGDELCFANILDLMAHTMDAHPNCCPYGDAACFSSFDELVTHIQTEHPGKRIPIHIFS